MWKEGFVTTIGKELGKKLLKALEKLWNESMRLTDEELVDLCKINDLSVLRRALQEGANVNALTDGNRTLLIEAAENGTLELVQLLLKYKADVKAHDYLGRTPLMMASCKRRPLIVKALIKEGAEVNEKDLKGYTALMYSVTHGQPETALALLQKGACTQITNDEGKKAIDFLQDNTETMKRFKDTEALRILQKREKKAKALRTKALKKAVKK